MKYLKSASFGVLLVFVTLSSMPQSTAQSINPEVAELRISVPKQEYMLGEPVKLERLFIRIGEVPVQLIGDDRQGPLRLFIAKNGDDFRQYTFSEWSLQNPEYWETPTRRKVFHTIFFNKKPETQHLNENARRRVEDRMIVTDYAFPEPGEYRIKAALVFRATLRSDRHSSRAVAESNEISITVRQADGDDARVWELMRSDPRIGYFMNFGEAQYRVLGTVLTKVDEITSEYPDSYLAGLLKVKAQEHRARQERYRLDKEERLKREKAVSASKKN